ncbi:MAG: DUF3145 family protein [Actinomycetota bacterium]
MSSQSKKPVNGPNTLEPRGIGNSHGRISIYSAPKVVLSHIQWSVSDALGRPHALRWDPQPLAPASWRTHLSWSGALGTGAKLASALRGWHYVAFEIYEAAANGSDGSIYLFTSELGLFRGNIGPHGDIMVNEHQLQNLLSGTIKDRDICEEIEKLVGKPWNDVLEPFRRIEIDGCENAAARISV